MAPLAGQSRLQIGELRDFDLELALERARAAREDVKDQLAAIDDPDLRLGLKIARLNGGQTVVKDRYGGVGIAGPNTKFLDLAFANERPRIDPLEFLRNLTSDLRSRVFGQRSKLGKRMFTRD
jgi:hypothetical protein